ncbi:MAG TPA: hypothetical protein VI643_07290 [Planctomycetota bacterium]|nr:hypothetical protein [Planctomycetota bacterium]
MKKGSVASFFTYLMLFAGLGVGIYALIVYVILPSIDSWHLDRMMRDVEKEGLKEAELPNNPLIIPGPAVEQMLVYEKKSIPFLLKLMDHLEFRIRAKAFEGLKKAANKDDFAFDPAMYPGDAKPDLDKVKAWWEEESKKPAQEQIPKEN